MSNQGQLLRGKKYSMLLEAAKAKGESKTVEWLNSQKSVFTDLNNYINSIKPKEEVKVSKKVK